MGISGKCPITSPVTSLSKRMPAVNNWGGNSLKVVMAVLMTTMTAVILRVHCSTPDADALGESHLVCPMCPQMQPTHEP